MRLLLIWAPLVAARHEASFQEPDPLEYFQTDGKMNTVPLRTSDVSKEVFDRLAIRGIPIVVSDAARDSKMKEWSCTYMHDHFDGAKFRREYDGREENFEKMDGDWTTKKIPIKGKKLAPGAPRYQPFYWDIVKAWEGEKSRGWGPNPKAIVKAVKGNTTVPYFLDDSNLKEMQDNPEFWFQPPETGSLAHSDEHCIPTIATTLSGVKLWRFSHVPSAPHPAGYFDGLIYTYDKPTPHWNPLYAVNVSAGEAVVFPPGMIHEAKSVGEVCASSATYQFSNPAPTVYWRSWWPRLRKLADMRHCYGLVAKWATLGGGTKQALPFAEAQKAALGIFKKADSDGDGKLTKAEIKKHVKNNAKLAMDAFNYHDNDENGVVTSEEFSLNYGNWAEVEQDAASSKKKKKKGKKSSEL